LQAVVGILTRNIVGRKIAWLFIRGNSCSSRSCWSLE